MKNALFIADAHIKSRTWTNNMSLQGDAYSALQLVEYKLEALPQESKPDTLIIGGDWFDVNRPTSTDLDVSYDFIRHFSKVLLIKGNHDRIDPSFLTLDRYGELIIDLGETTSSVLLDTTDNAPVIYGVPWQTSGTLLTEELKRIASNIRTAEQTSISYVVLHASFQHLLGIDGAYQITHQSVSEIFKDLNVRILVGDIHKRDTLVLDGGIYIHSPGSLYPLSWDRTQEACAVSLIDVHTGDITPIDCTVRQYHSIEWTSAYAVQQAVMNIARNARDMPCIPYVRLNIHGVQDYIRPDTTGVELQVVDDSAAQEVTAAASTAPDITFEGALGEELAGDEVLKNMGLQLLATDDPFAEIADWLEFWGVETIK